MTAPARGASEAIRVAAAFQFALARLGVLAILRTLRLWRRVPANRIGQVVKEWVDEATELTMRDRELARDLALAYYRLNRALRTGHTVPDPDKPLPQRTTLGELRRDFREVLDRVDRAASTESADRLSTRPASKEPPETVVKAPEAYRGGPENDTTNIPVEDVDGVDSKGDSEQDRLREDAEEEARLVLAAMSETLRKRLEALKSDRPAQEVDTEREQLHSTSGSRQAAAVERMVRNGARTQITSLAERDRRVIGYVRVSRTGTPCGWCAMLISRGLILYRTRESAAGKTGRARTVAEGDAEVGDAYHNNCKCYPEPVYSQAQFGESTYDLNREYAKLWPQVTKGLSGKAALSAWRRFIRQQESDSTNAQVA